MPPPITSTSNLSVKPSVELRAYPRCRRFLGVCRMSVLKLADLTPLMDKSLVQLWAMLSMLSLHFLPPIKAQVQG